MNVNLAALLAVFAFAGVMLVIFGTLYAGAVRSYHRDELGFEGIRILRWALVGLIALAGRIVGRLHCRPARISRNGQPHASAGLPHHLLCMGSIGIACSLVTYRNSG